MREQRNGQAEFSILGAALVVGAIAVVGVAGWFVYEHNRPQVTGATGGSQATNQNTGRQTTIHTTQPTTGAYASNKERASFKYPSTWTVAKYSITSGDASNADHIGLVSPSGAITISYVTDLSGFGNEHTASYPYNMIVGKTAIAGARGLYVVSGMTTLDSTTYYPWIAVQDTGGVLATGVQGDLATFSARHAADASTHSLTRLLFATCGVRTTQNSPALTQAQAIAWFSGAEAQQAKQILLSFTDAQ